MNKKTLLCLLISGVAVGTISAEELSKDVNPSEIQVIENDTNLSFYKEEWPSIARHSCPEWFRDAKFGIYTCLSPVTVATQHHTTEWYGWAMYADTARQWTYAPIPNAQTPREFTLHKELFGEQEDFGYTKIIEMFNPEKFDAEEWAEIFEGSGAKFCGPMGCHHDNYMLWDSKVTRWNSMATAGVDMVGDLEKAIRKRDMKMVMTFHHAFSWWFWVPSYKYEGSNPEFEDLYCRPHKFNPDNDSFSEYPDAEYEDLWYRKLDEALVNYAPDLIWFDMGLELLSDNIRKKAYARILNLAKYRNQDVGISYKIKYDVCIPPRAGILDYEKGRSTVIREDPWLTDTPLGGWFYNGLKSRSSKAVIEILLDITSKNGCMMLCVSPKPDGTIPDDQQKTLKEMGEWLKVNGEAVYNTRPWVIAGEGPTQLSKDGHFNENWEAIYTEKDLRYTRSKDNNTLYITVMNRPTQGKVVATQLATIYPYLDREIESISLLGSDTKIGWKRSKKGLELDFPKDTKGVSAWAYKVELKK